MINKSIYFKIRVTPELKKEIEEKAKIAGVSMSELVRNLVNDAKIFHKYDRMVLGQLRRIGVNLNQIALHLNAGLPLKPEINDSFRRVLAALENELKK